MRGVRRATWRLLLVGTTCLLAGIVVGHFWPRPARAVVWPEDPRAPSPTVASMPSFADVVAKVGPGVVSVRASIVAANFSAERHTQAADSLKGANGQPEAHGDLPPGQALTTEQKGSRTGSGFVVHARGLVVTSRHVVAGARAIEVLVPTSGTRFAEVVGEDSAADLALLRLIDPPSDLAPLTLGRSEDLRAGDWIVAVGNPFGFSQTVTAGVVSFVGRHLTHTDLGVTNDFLQISAPVNPGSSGSPVLDLQGRVVGVTTQAATAAQGISFAVPSRTLKWALEAMEREPDGRVRRGYLGIEFVQRLDRDLAGAPCGGAVITRVREGDPAERAGLRKGDIVLRVDGEPIADATALQESIVRKNPGTRIAVQLLRQGRVQDPIEAVLGEVGGPKTATPF